MNYNEETMTFCKADITGNIAKWIILQSKRIPCFFSKQIRAADLYIDKNQPHLFSPTFAPWEILKEVFDGELFYTMHKDDLHSYLLDMVENDPDLKRLGERRPEDGGDSLSEYALVRNIMYAIEQNQIKATT